MFMRVFKLVDVVLLFIVISLILCIVEHCFRAEASCCYRADGSRGEFENSVF